ncbi:YeeE/YedE family protein [Gluconacetobacter aggeris]|uniref:YeeE/YedE family protein n=1 Tax=Gluconacetobacter aggeris TaxID=1286186 RepID=A0A7W4ISX1_9PROT|nr:YeeE/YedE family protein [Gluconacetobacter aggeris]
MNIIVALGCGLLFGFGLALSGMVDPARVLGFLDLAGAWDPSLIFVLGGAVSVSFLGYRLSRRMSRPVCTEHFDLPTRTAIDRRLIGGAALFGIGWGLAGLCPGPAIVSLGLAQGDGAVFAVAMMAGMLVESLP